MSRRIFHALGTASQVPTRARNHNGYFLEWDGQGFLFDPGEGTQRQMIHAGVSASAISNILITHFHGDHCLGLAGILQRLSLDRVEHDVQIYYPASGRQFFENLRHASVYHETTSLVPREVEQNGVLEHSGSLTLTTRKLDHTVESWGYRLEEASSVTLLPEALAELGIAGPLVGHLKRDGHLEHRGRVVRVEEVSQVRPGQSFAFVMDTRLCEAAFELASGVDVLVAESTFQNVHEDLATAHGHLTAAHAARIASDAGAGLLVLTHFSQRYEDLQVFLDEARVHHDNVVVVADGDTVPFPKRRVAIAQSSIAYRVQAGT